MGESPRFLEHFDQHSRSHIEPGPCVKSIHRSEIAALGDLAETLPIIRWDFGLAFIVTELSRREKSNGESFGRRTRRKVRTV
jgi:hypothetical protein